MRGYRGGGPDPEKLKGATVQRATLRRVWRFLAPYRPRLAAYLAVILVTAAVGADPAAAGQVPHRRRHPPTIGCARSTCWRSAWSALALGTTALSLLNRWFASVIGEGIIYDLRVALFDHVQRMPIAFFTRTQTGSLMSRLTNDVLDAQNAVGTVASVVSDVMTLVATLAADVRAVLADHLAGAAGAAAVHPPRPADGPPDQPGCRAGGWRSTRT